MKQRLQMTILMVLTGRIIFGQTYPAPVDIPSAPAGVVSPGGIALPSMGGSVNPNCAISAISEITSPNETMVITGSGLTGAKFAVWAEGMNLFGDTLRTSDILAQVVVPPALPYSCMLVWPIKNNQAGRPIRVNGATTWWMWPHTKFTDETDRIVRIFGKNLSIPGLSPKAVVINSSGTATDMKVVQSNPYEIQAQFPSGLPVGNYTVQVHNGSGGIYGWSEPTYFDIAQNPYQPTMQYIVDAQPGSTDQDKITAAISAAANHTGGGIVIFSKRSYTVTSRIDIPDNAGNPVFLKGAGKCVFNYLSNSFDNSGTALVGNMATPVLWIMGRGTRVQDMSFFNTGTNTCCDNGIAVRNKDVILENLVVVSADGSIGTWSDHSPDDGLNLRILGCDVYTHEEGISLHQANYDRFCLISGCSINGLGSGDVGNNGISARGVTNLIVEKTLFRSVAPLSGKSLCRSLLVIENYSRNFYIAHNRSIAVGAFPSPTRDPNSGEQFLLHGGNGGYCFNNAVVDASGQTLTINQTVASLPSDIAQRGHCQVYVAGGKGMGQVRVVTGIQDNGGQAQLQLDKPWRVIPDTSSRAYTGVFFREMAFFGNYIDAVPDSLKITPDFNRSGFQPWERTYDCIIDSNTIKHVRQAIRVEYDVNGPHIWHVVRRNRMSDLDDGGPYGGKGEFIAETAGGGNLDANRMVTVGNVYRENTGINATRAGDIGYSPNPYSQKQAATINQGELSTVVENNIFNNITDPLMIQGYSNWLLVRCNQMPTSSQVSYLQPTYILSPLVIKCSATSVNVEKELLSDFNIYPNPSSGILTIDYKKSEKPLTLIVNDVLGKTILSKKYNSAKIHDQIDLSQFPNGMYVIRLQAEGQSGTVKVIKQ